jgi:hypothetical protein
VTPLDMNPGIRARWTAALRSGDYKQTTGALRRLPEQVTLSGREGYCCLGVLTDLWLKDGGDEMIPAKCGCGDHLVSVWDEGTGVLSDPVVQWAGLNYADPVLNPATDWFRASHLNDDNWTFAQIADVIDGVKPAGAKATP